MRPTILALLILACAANGQWSAMRSRPAANTRFHSDVGKATPRFGADRHPRPTLGPSGSSVDDGEFVLDTTFRYVQAPKHQCATAVGYNGSDFLVAWQDGRSEVYGVYGTRVTPAGAVLDSAGVLISPADGRGQNPAIAYDGANYLVVWEDYRSGSPQVCGAFIDAGGQLRDTLSLHISHDSSGGTYPAVAFDGTNYLVVWELDQSWGICGARVTPAGQLLDTSAITISTAYYCRRPDVAFDGDNCLVVWQDDRDVGNTNIHGARISPDGVVLDTADILISGATDGQYYPAIVHDGAGSLVVWQDRRRREWDIYGARVTSEGAVLDTAGIVISTSDRSRYYPAVAFDGTNSIVIWEDYRFTGSADLYAARVSADGSVLDSAGILVSSGTGNQCFPAVAFGGAQFLAAWEDRRLSVSWADVFAARISPDGSVFDSLGFEASFAASSQRSPAVASNGSDFLAAWADERSDSADIYGARFAPDGTLLDTSSIRICARSSQQRSPAVASIGADFLVTWEDSRSSSFDIYGTRVTGAGQVIDTLGVPLSRAAGNQCSPVAASIGVGYLVVWQDSRDGEYDIYGSRVTSAGTVQDPAGIPVSTATHLEVNPAVATNGANYLAVWSGQTFDQRIYGARVSPAGVVLDPAGIAISDEAYRQDLPSVASDGAGFLVVWTTAPRPNPYYNDYDILGARISPEGVVLDSPAILISAERGDQYNPSVTFDGANYLVFWEERESGMFHPDIHGARVTPNGVTLDTFTAVAQKGGQYDIGVAHGPGHQMTLLYRGWVGKHNGKTYNTYRVWGKMDPFGAVQEPTASGTEHLVLAATLIHGVLLLPSASGVKRVVPSVLLDVSGRHVAELHPGANDVRHLSPGVYFIRERRGAGDAGQGQVRKVVIAR